MNKNYELLIQREEIQLWKVGKNNRFNYNKGNNAEFFLMFFPQSYTKMNYSS